MAASCEGTFTMERPPILASIALVGCLVLVVPAGGQADARGKPRRAPAAEGLAEGRTAARVGSAEARVRLRLPVGSRVEAVALVVEGEESNRIEDQAAQDPDTVLTIGRLRSRVVGFDDSKVLERGQLADHAGVFYVFSGVEVLKEFSITPFFFRDGDEIVDTGRTPPIIRIEALVLDRIGDTEGEVARVLDGVALELGEENRIPLPVRIPRGKKAGVRVSIPQRGRKEKEVFLHVKAARKGRNPANQVTVTGGGSESTTTVFGAAVRFVFVARLGDIDTFGEDPRESLLAQINRYLARHRSEGEGGEVEVPLRVRLQLR